MARKKVEDLTPADLIAAAGQEINRLKALVAELEVELKRQRERANEALSRWEFHEKMDCALKCAREIEEVLRTRDPVVAARLIRTMKEQLEACEKELGLKDPGHTSMYWRTWGEGDKNGA